MKKILLSIFLIFVFVPYSISAEYDTISVNTVEGVPMAILVSKVIMNGKQPVLVRKNCISTSTKGTITVPEEVERKGVMYKVTGIQNDAFKDCSLLTKVNMPNSISSLGNAFQGCSSLTDITVPDGITELFGTFEHCTNFKSVKIGSSVKKLLSTFRGCTSLESIIIPENVEIISDAFIGCTNLESITLNNGLKSIGGFKDCVKLKEITLPETVTTIGSFEGCVGLTKFIIPQNVTSITSKAFYGCTGLTSLSIPGNVTQIGLNAFNGCKIKKLILENGSTTINLRYNTELNKGLFVCSDESELTELYIGRNMSVLTGDKSPLEGMNSLTSIEYGNVLVSVADQQFSGNTNLKTVKLGCASIGNKAFYGCTNLESVTINEGVITIGKEAFSGCSNLKSLSLGNSLQSIGMNAFYGCSSLTEVVIPASTTFMYAGAFNYCTSLSSVRILGKVKGVGGFSGCTSLRTIDLADGIEEIYSNAFFGCKSLLSITIPQSVTIIREYAFSGCSSLSAIKLSENLKTIEKYAFNETAMESIIIPPNVANLNDYCFYNNKQLKNVYSGIIAPTAISENVFKNIASDSKLYVPYGCLSKYQQKGGWSSFSTIKEMSVKEGDIISASFRNGNTSFTGSCVVTGKTPFEVQLGDGTAVFTTNISGDLQIPSEAVGYDGTSFLITSIGSNAIACEDISTLDIAYTITSIKSNAFLSCSNIHSITVRWRHPTKIDIAKDAFNNLSENAVLYVPAGTKSRYEEIEVWQKFSQIIEVSPISVGDVTTGMGSKTNLPIILNNTEVISGIQCKLTLPEGVSLEEEEGGPIALLTNRTEGFTVMSRKDPDAPNSYLFLLFSMDGNPISGNEGAVMNVRISVDPNVEMGKYETLLEDVSLATATFETRRPVSGVSELTIDDSFAPTDPRAFIPFKDEKVKAICIANWDTNGDNELDTSEASAVTDLRDVFGGNKEIISFDELQYFTGLTSIGEYAFDSCSALKSIKIPNSVTSFEDEAFACCSALTSIEIPNSVTYLGESAFSGCSALTSIEIPNSVTSIGEGAFQNCI